MEKEPHVKQASLRPLLWGESPLQARSQRGVRLGHPFGVNTLMYRTPHAPLTSGAGSVHV